MIRLLHQPWKLAVCVGAVAGIAVAATMMYIAWQHNAQGEIHDEDGVHWFYLGAIGATWLVSVAAPMALGVGAIAASARRIVGATPINRAKTDRPVPGR